MASSEEEMNDMSLVVGGMGRELDELVHVFRCGFSELILAISTFISRFQAPSTLAGILQGSTLDVPHTALSIGALRWRPGGSRQ